MHDYDNPALINNFTTIMRYVIILLTVILASCATKAPIPMPAPMKTPVPVGEMGATVRGHSIEKDQ